MLLFIVLEKTYAAQQKNVKSRGFEIRKKRQKNVKSKNV